MKKSNNGFTLIELSIVVAISMMAIMWGLWSKVQISREQLAISQADALRTLANSVDTWTVNNFESLVNNTAIPGFANIYAPTVAELVAAGALTNNFSANNLFGTGYQIALSRVPAGCTPPACDVSFLINLTGAINDYHSGLIDGPVLGAATNRIGANAGFSTNLAPGTITGSNNGWSAVNPVLNAGNPVAVYSLSVVDTDLPVLRNSCAATVPCL